jgi:hypothetical protein
MTSVSLVLFGALMKFFLFFDILGEDEMTVFCKADGIGMGQ